MGYFVNPVDIKVKAGTVWQCCGDISAEEDPSFLTFWEGEELRGRLVDTGCDDLPAHFLMMTEDQAEPYLPVRIETPSPQVAARLGLMLRNVQTRVAAQPYCIPPALANEHACVMMAAVVPQSFALDVPPATARRAVAALVGLMDKPDWKRLPGPVALSVDHLADRPLVVVFRDGARDIEIRPAGPLRKSEVVRLRSKRYPLMGTEWEWLRATGGKGPLARRQVDILCGVAEILVTLGRDGLPDTPRSLVLGNWLKLPRSVCVTCSVAQAAA